MSLLVAFLVIFLALALFACVARLVLGPARKPAKIGLFLTVVLILAVAFLPIPDGWGWGLLLFFAALLFMIATLASLAVMPDNDMGDLVHEKLWGRLSDPNDPNSGPKTPPVRIVQLVCTGVIVLVMFVTFIVQSAQAWNIEGDTPRQETTTSSAPPSTSSSPTTTSTTPSAAPSIAWASSSTPQGCNAPTLADISKSVPFVGTDKLQVCRDGKWAAWEGAHPSTVTLTAWKDEGEYGYGRFKVGDTAFLIRTTDF